MCYIKKYITKNKSKMDTNEIDSRVYQTIHFYDRIHEYGEHYWTHYILDAPYNFTIIIEDNERIRIEKTTDIEYRLSESYGNDFFQPIVYNKKVKVEWVEKCIQFYEDKKKLVNREKELQSIFSTVNVKKETINYLTNFKNAIKHHKKGEYEEAVKLLESIIVPTASNEAVYYNIACGYSMLNKLDEAFKYLDLAVKNNFTNWIVFHKDTRNDLKNLIGDPRFEIYDKLKEDYKQKYPYGFDDNFCY